MSKYLSLCFVTASVRNLNIIFFSRYYYIDCLFARLPAYLSFIVILFLCHSVGYEWSLICTLSDIMQIDELVQHLLDMTSRL